MMHTPGPWKFGVRKYESIWLSIGDPKSGPHYQGDLYASVDDARLIAAAPELLESLKEMRDACAVCFRVIAKSGLADEMEQGMIASDVKEGFGARSGDIIAKAEGR